MVQPLGLDLVCRSPGPDWTHQIVGCCRTKLESARPRALKPNLLTLGCDERQCGIYHRCQARLDESQTSIKIARRNNNLRYAESEEELESLDQGEREEWKSWLKLRLQKTKVMASGPITSWQIEGGTMETVAYFIFLGSKISRWWLQPWN